MFDLLYDLSKEMNDFLGGKPGVASIPVDVVYKDDTYYVYASIPGVKKENIDISFENSVLTIKAKREMNDDDKTNYLLKERIDNEYERTLRFKNFKEESIKASYENGILGIAIKVAKPDVKNIVIE